jgi:hypothetical protein
MAWVVGALGGESAFVGVAVIELSEEHGVIPGGAEGGPTLPSAITLASVSRNAAVQFSPAALNFGHFGRLLREVCLQTWAGGGLAAVSRRAVMPACRGSLTRRQPGASLPVFKGGTPAPNGVGHRSLVSGICSDGMRRREADRAAGRGSWECSDDIPWRQGAPRLAAILTAGVLALACLAGSAKADTLPRFYIGKWCPEFEGSETFERAEQPSCGDKELTITSRGLVDAVYRCRFTHIRLGKAWPPATNTNPQIE